MNNNDETRETLRFSYSALQELPINWKWMIFLGLSMIIFGTLGLLASSFLTLTSVLMFGGFIFAGGIMQLIHVVKVKEEEWGGKLQHLFIALLYIVAGVVIFFDPFSTSLVLTILLASLFAVIGVAKIWYAFFCKKQGWKWLLPAFSGLLNLILTAIVIASLPESAFWLIGLLIAVEMLMSGWFLFLLGLRVRQIEQG
ncbi:HdeD family acid-resistance protein [methanotrophic endosymbiont of Bathymodiolus puteoserpentis (Logatchev)]|jgi:uncharacterized membrane protein HdeD (DUF308 family)|uniref:HdeD family acid-resistance protein n=1 Tax=methanotrophic endosymbiont of Bathymodiolus puteoserpentis (Logatchev) TaxID=343235 RepID=UPI0013C79FE4|nr:HdeD family acid-resistance protein [methanotrophic endosymbiont of Bathymodiolus puteoserpentis (Logatchev)]SHE19300.1 hypothetical protein BPUTEOMOX_206 [methanotrophic endosymbiont of Bathymodiolus puteoserpentis (Logatchev)]